LYRGGLTIRTTLDKPLQEDLHRRIDASQDARFGENGTISVVRQGGVVRAIVCEEGQESEIRSQFEIPGLPNTGYDVSVLTADSVTREQIILPSAATGTPGLSH